MKEMILLFSVAANFVFCYFVIGRLEAFMKKR